MLYLATGFFLIAIFAAILGGNGIAQDPLPIGKFIAIVGVTLAVLSFWLHWRVRRN